MFLFLRLLWRHGTTLHSYGGRGGLNDLQKQLVVAYLCENPMYRIATLMQHLVVKLGEAAAPNEEKVVVLAAIGYLRGAKRSVHSNFNAHPHLTQSVKRTPNGLDGLVAGYYRGSVEPGTSPSTPRPIFLG